MIVVKVAVIIPDGLWVIVNVAVVIFNVVVIIIDGLWVIPEGLWVVLDGGLGRQIMIRWTMIHLPCNSKALS